MAGIVTSTKQRKLVGNRLKEIDVPKTTLDTSLFYADLTAQGAGYTPARVNAELNAYPAVVKNNASLAFTPSANKVGVVYAMNGDSKTLEELEFQRGSSATFFSSSGVMGLAAPNEPRINFDAGISKGLLIEPSSSNLFTDSGLVNGLASFATRSSTGLVAVDSNFNFGTLMSKGIQVSKQSEIVYAYKLPTFANNKMHVLSVYVKMADNSKPTTTDFAFITQGAVLRFQDRNVINCGNDVYRVFVEYLTLSSGANSYFGIAKYTADSAKSFIFTGLQLEESAVATSYIPTTTAVATRLADKVLSKRPTVVFPKNSMYVKTAEFAGAWFGNGVPWAAPATPLATSYIKIDVNGNIEISHTEPIHLQQFSLISRELKQEEV